VPLPLDGGAAETIAARHLESLGYRILARNVKSKRGELDIVARDGRTLCFVEVRLRKSSSLAFASIDPRKQRSLARAAEHYLLANRLSSMPCRFDVVAIANDGQPTLIRDAFGSV